MSSPDDLNMFLVDTNTPLGLVLTRQDTSGCPWSWFERTKLVRVGFVNTLCVTPQDPIDLETKEQSIIPHIRHTVARHFGMYAPTDKTWVKDGTCHRLTDRVVDILFNHFKPDFTNATWPDHIHYVMRQKGYVTLWIVTGIFVDEQGNTYAVETIRNRYDRFGNNVGNYSDIPTKGVRMI
jgi:hypothetical protein